MKVLVVSEYARPWPGGISEHVHHEADELSRRGHEVTIATGPGPVLDDPRAVRLPRALRFVGNGAASRLSYGSSLLTLRRRLRAFDVVHVHAPLDPILPLWAVLAAEVPVVGTFHASFAPSWAWSALYRSPPCRAAFRKLAGRVVVSAEAERSVAAYFPDASYLRVPNGVDLRRFRRSRARSSAAPGLLFVGRADPRKGLGDAIAAFVALSAKWPEARLQVVGPTAREVERVLGRAVPRGVVVHGYVAPEAMPGCYAEADLLLAPSTSGESQGIVLLEALAAGTVPIAYDIPGYRETLSEGSGRLVRPNVDALVDAAAALLADAALRAATAEAGARWVTRYDWSHVGGQLEAVLREACVAQPSLRRAASR